MNRVIRFVVCLLILVVNLETEASTLRNSFVDNINSGIKLAETLIGLSNNVADLVSQSFSQNTSNGNRQNARQDSVTVGDPGTQTALDQSMVSGMLKLLGFDGAKIGAAAVNGIIFIAQMVRYGVNNLMNYAMGRMWDWYRIVDYISDRIRTSNNTFFNEVTITVPAPIEHRHQFPLHYH